MREFLAHFINEKPGKVLNLRGQTIGSHSGAYFYTIGQRHGFQITTEHTRSAPLYVVEKNIAKNTITVAEKINNALDAAERKEVRLSNVNWIQGAVLPQNVRYHARARYHERLAPCVLRKVGKRSAMVAFTRPHLVAPGQSLVIYRHGECVGGGVIESE